MKFAILIGVIITMICVFFIVYRNKLIPNIHEFAKFWSIRLAALGVALQGFVTAFPDTALNTWAMLPPELKNFLPPNMLQYATILVFVASMLARIVKQKKLDAPIMPPTSIQGNAA